MASLKDGDQIELQLINGKFWYINGNGQFAEFPTGSATGSYPEGTKIYRATLTQVSPNAPVATVLQSSLSDTLVMSRNGNGDYLATLVGEFPDPTKVFIVINQTFANNYFAYWNDANSIAFGSFNQLGNPSDNLLQNTAFEIVVYP